MYITIIGSRKTKIPLLKYWKFDSIIMIKNLGFTVLNLITKTKQLNL